MNLSIPVFELKPFNSHKFTGVVRYEDAFARQGCSCYQYIIGADRFASIFEISANSCRTFHLLTTKRQNIDGSSETFLLKTSLLRGARLYNADTQLKEHDGGNTDAS